MLITQEIYNAKKIYLAPGKSNYDIKDMVY